MCTISMFTQGTCLHSRDNSVSDHQIGLAFTDGVCLISAGRDEIAQVTAKQRHGARATQKIIISKTPEMKVLMAQ